MHETVAILMCAYFENLIQVWTDVAIVGNVSHWEWWLLLEIFIAKVANKDAYVD